jgi:hypothetical protein
VLYWLADFFTGAPPGTNSRNRRCIRFSACTWPLTAHRWRSHRSRSATRPKSALYLA